MDSTYFLLQNLIKKHMTVAYASIACNQADRNLTESTCKVIRYDSNQDIWFGSAQDYTCIQQAQQQTYPQAVCYLNIYNGFESSRLMLALHELSKRRRWDAAIHFSGSWISGVILNLDVGLFYWIYGLFPQERSHLGDV